MLTCAIQHANHSTHFAACAKNEDGKKCDANKSDENEFYLNHESKANPTTTVVDLHDICRPSTEQMWVCKFQF